ncbi:hypothetical protein C8J57DRAFT_1516865 [Mycena rebaudengoi]|nr:hypothetical protein C8J57DRAFT_1516865 [Mycena rebaudengoi]
MFIFALILNPYECLDRFGAEAGMTVFTLSNVLMELYRRTKSRPPPAPLSDEEETALKDAKARKEAQVKISFMRYMAGTGAFADWEENRDAFGDTTDQDPILVWEQFRTEAETAELADLAILLLGMAINQGGNECDFSDFKTPTKFTVKL